MNIESFEAHWQFQCRKALEQMEFALAILDQVEGPSDAGAHLDLAICRLRVALVESKKAIQSNAILSGGAEAISA